MKNYKEIADSVFERSHTIIEQKKRSRKAVLRTTFLCVPLCAVLFFAIFHISEPLLPPAYYESENGSGDSASCGEISAIQIEYSDVSGDSGDSSYIEPDYWMPVEPDCSIPDVDVSDTDGTSTDHNPEGDTSGDTDVDNAFIHWQGKDGKIITSELYEKLKKADEGDVFDITVKPYGYVIGGDDTEFWNFQFNGRLISEIYVGAYGENRDLLNKLGGLIKFGEELKYGETLYTEGLADGTKWSKEYYEEIVEYFGREILDKYIVGEEFLIDKLNSDKAEIWEYVSAAQKAYQSACDAYFATRLVGIENDLENQKIHTYRNAEGSVLLIKVTVSEFESIRLDHPGKWLFDTSDAGGGTDMDDNDAAVTE